MRCLSKKAVKFAYKQEQSKIFGRIHSPYVRVKLWAALIDSWLEVEMLLDTGADYTILPRFLADELQIDLDKDCKIFKTVGVGGSQKVYFYEGLKVRLGDFECRIPVGFMDSDSVPPLMGRQGFIEKFVTVLEKKKQVTFRKK